MKINIEEFNQLMRERRSVFPKDYTGERVNDSVVNQMLENANLAPTHKFTEPWRFVVFADGGLKKLADFQGECYKKVTAVSNSYKEEKYQALLTKPLQSSHIIAIGMKRDSRKSVPEVEELGAAFCAVENMYLTAAAYGVGCYLSTGGITYFDEAKEFFGLTEDDKLLGFLHVGIPKSWPVQSKRSPVNEKVKWVK